MAKEILFEIPGGAAGTRFSVPFYCKLLCMRELKIFKALTTKLAMMLGLPRQKAILREPAESDALAVGINVLKEVSGARKAAVNAAKSDDGLNRYTSSEGRNGVDIVTVSDTDGKAGGDNIIEMVALVDASVEAVAVRIGVYWSSSCCYSPPSKKLTEPIGTLSLAAAAG